MTDADQLHREALHHLQDAYQQIRTAHTKLREAAARGHGMADVRGMSLGCILASLAWVGRAMRADAADE